MVTVKAGGPLAQIPTTHSAQYKTMYHSLLYGRLTKIIASLAEWCTNTLLNTYDRFGRGNIDNLKFVSFYVKINRCLMLF